MRKRFGPNLTIPTWSAPNWGTRTIFLRRPAASVGDPFKNQGGYPNNTPNNMFFFLLRARLGCAPWPDQPLPHSLNLTSLLIALNAHFVVLLKLQGSVPFFRFLDPPGDFSKSSNLHKLRICFSLRRGAQVNVLWFPDRGSELHLPGGFPSADGCASDEVESNPSLASRAAVSPTAPEPLEPC